VLSPASIRHFDKARWEWRHAIYGCAIKWTHTSDDFVHKFGKGKNMGQPK